MHAETRPTEPGEIRPSPARIAWLAAALAGGPLLAAWHVTPAAIAVWAALTAITLCAGHSVGLHRGLIHGAFAMGPRTARVLAYLAVQTGLGGPLSMMAVHGLRDRWQNQPRCPEYYGYDHGLALDAWWYLGCDHHPRGGDFQPEIPEEHRLDPYYLHLDRWWRAHVLASALPLYFMGGTAWVVWGLGMRVATSVVGHWLVNYLAHTRGEQPWTIDGAGEQGRNHRWLGALSMGEGWHNNHHAFPRSARLGIGPGELDPGWLVVRALRRAGLVWDVLDAEDAGLKPGARPTGLDRENARLPLIARDGQARGCDAG